MKIIYNILIISILCTSNAWSQDSLKNVLSDRKEENVEIHIDNRKLTKNLEKVQNNLNAVARTTTINRNYRRNLDGNWKQDAPEEDNPIEKKKTITR